MTTLFTNVARGLKNVHQQEEGMEALQTALITALATIVLAFAYKMMTGGDTSGKGGILGGVSDLITSGLTSFKNKTTGIFN